MKIKVQGRNFTSNDAFELTNFPESVLTFFVKALDLYICTSLNIHVRSVFRAETYFMKFKNEGQGSEVREEDPDSLRLPSGKSSQQDFPKPSPHVFSEPSLWIEGSMDFPDIIMSSSQVRMKEVMSPEQKCEESLSPSSSSPSKGDENLHEGSQAKEMSQLKKIWSETWTFLSNVDGRESDPSDFAYSIMWTLKEEADCAFDIFKSCVFLSQNLG